MTRVMRSPFWAALLASLLTASLFGAVQIANAAVSGNNDRFSGCLAGGALTKVAVGSTPTAACTGGEIQVQWNQAQLQHISALQGRVAALEALLAGVTRSGNNLAFPGSVEAAVNLVARNNIHADNTINASNDVTAGDEMFAVRNITAGNNVEAMNNVTARNNVHADNTVNASVNVTAGNDVFAVGDVAAGMSVFKDCSTACTAL